MSSSAPPSWYSRKTPTLASVWSGRAYPTIQSVVGYKCKHGLLRALGVTQKPRRRTELSGQGFHESFGGDDGVGKCPGKAEQVRIARDRHIGFTCYSKLQKGDVEALATSRCIRRRAGNAAVSRDTRGWMRWCCQAWGRGARRPAVTTGKSVRTDGAHAPTAGIFGHPLRCRRGGSLGVAAQSGRPLSLKPITSPATRAQR